MVFIFSKFSFLIQEVHDGSVTLHTLYPYHNFTNHYLDASDSKIVDVLKYILQIFHPITNNYLSRFQ